VHALVFLALAAAMVVETAVLFNPLRTVGHRPKRAKLQHKAPPKGVEKHYLPLAPWGHFVGKGLTL
jgi:hypothetical protein